MPPGLDDWDRHWSVYSRAAERNPAQTYRRRLILDTLPSSGGGRGERILDFGSGIGALAAELRRRFPAAEIVGIELSREGVDRARQAVPTATFFQRDLLRESVEPTLQGWATVAVCSEVLEHVDQPQRLLCGIVPYLAPGCRLVVTVPGGPMSAFDRSIGHRRHFTPGSLRLVLEEAGFTVLWARRSGFPFFNLYRLVVIMRGERIESDVQAAAARGRSSAPTTAAMKAFDRLFRFNLRRTPFGWQIVALATLSRHE